MERERAPAEAGEDRRLYRNPTIAAAVIGLIGSVVVAVIQNWPSGGAQPSEKPGINCLEGPVGGATPNGGAPPSEGPQITCPKEGDGVLHQLTVRGTALMQDKEHFWVIVQKHGDNQYKPQRRKGFEWVSETEGTWTWLAYIGSRDNPKTGDAYNVIVVKLPDGVCQEIEDYLKAKEDYDKAADKGQKPQEPLRGLDHLPCEADGATTADSVKVTRR